MKRTIHQKTTLKKTVAGTLLATGLLVAPLAPLTSASASSPDAGPAAAPLAQLGTGTNGVETMSCSTGNFRGEVEFTPTFGAIRGEGVGNVDRVGMKILRYKITRSNGQQGGSKANLQNSFTVNKGSSTGHSGDNLRQDGQWHAVDRDVEAYIFKEKLRENGNYLARINFTFDKSGSDPQCATIKHLKINPVMTGKSEQKTTRHDDLWGSCRNQDLVEQTCTISREISRTNTFTAGLSVPVAWLTGSISNEWTTTYAYTNGWSPRVPPGKTAYVYGAGTHTTFSVAWKIGTATSPAQSGTAYRYNGSVLEVGP